MRFPVPQFIDVEDKIFGPLTLKQFIYLAGGGGISVVLYLFLPLYLAIIFIVPIAIFSVALAFYKPNNRPFVHMIESMFKYITSSRLYTWKKRPKQPSESVKNYAVDELKNIPKLSSSKLEDISWNVDVKEKNE